MYVRLADDRGAAALFIAAGMMLFLGMAALAVDLGLGFNERRQDQSTADASVMAGALEAVNGTDAMVTQAIEYNVGYARRNLDTAFTAAEWQTAWEGCVDPAADRNAGGFNFVPLAPPVSWGWTVSDPNNWCISIDASEFLFRVRLPQQIVPTTFGRILGVNELRTSASAVAKISVGGGGILPFGLSGGDGGGGLVCLSSNPPGLAEDPCTVIEGNFGTVRLLKFGNSQIPTNESCVYNQNSMLPENIAHGADHIVFRDLDGVAANQVVDQCYLPNVDTLKTDTGFPNNVVHKGLVGPTILDPPYSYTPRLSQAAPTRSVFGGFNVNDSPLWSYLDGSATYGGDPVDDDAPLICAPSTFDGGSSNWDLDPMLEPNRSWEHMQACIDEYVSNGYLGVMFTANIAGNAARFVYVPEFWDAIGPGSGDPENIRYFRAAYLQGTVWRKTGGPPLPTSYIAMNPGEQCYDVENGLGYLPSCNPPSGNWEIVVLTGFVIPDSSLPESLRGSSIAGTTGLNPFSPELFR